MIATTCTGTIKQVATSTRRSSLLQTRATAAPAALLLLLHLIYEAKVFLPTETILLHIPVGPIDASSNSTDCL